MNQQQTDQVYVLKDPSLFAAFTRALRQELDDAWTLNRRNHEQIEESTKEINRLPCDTIDSTSDQIDRKRVCVEITHDPSRCAQRCEAFDHSGTFSLCIVRWRRTLFYAGHWKSTFTKSIDPQHFGESNNGIHRGRNSWRRARMSAPSTDYLITADSLFCARTLVERNTYSIDVEHNGEFN